MDWERLCKIKADSVLHPVSQCLKLRIWAGWWIAVKFQWVCCTSHRDKQPLPFLKAINLTLFISHYIHIMVFFSDFFPLSVKSSSKTSTQVIQFKAAERITQKWFSDNIVEIRKNKQTNTHSYFKVYYIMAAFSQKKLHKKLIFNLSLNSFWEKDNLTVCFLEAISRF